MADKDSLQRFVFENAPVRGEYVHLEDSYQTIINQHNYPEPLRKLLGEALCAASLMSAIIKFDGRLTVQFRGKGKLKMLLAQCDNNLSMRALAQWDGELTHDDLMASFREGTLGILIDSGPSKGRYQGVVAWQGDSLAESLEGYFKDSEQLATKIWFSVTDTTAAGLLMQVVPSTNKKIEEIESELVKPHWTYAVKMTENLTSEDLLNREYETLLTKLFPEEEIRVFPSTPVAFKCTCSRKRGVDAIRLLGEVEADEELKGKNSIVVTCDFCNQQYLFDRSDVDKIFHDNDDEQPPTNIQIH
ncbi:MAG: Hsp33 family molecular chaperone HslO [Gammaproteobacteria bacterium]